MSTRRTNPGINVPITDPKAILCAARAEQHCVQRTAAHQAAETEAQEASQPNPNLNIPPTTPAGLTSASRTPSVDPPGRTAHQDTAKAAATREAIRVMIATQKASIVQGQADREASALRMSRIEEAILLLSMKAKPTPPPPAHKPSGRVDLQKFKTTNRPIFSGPFHAIEPFLNWVKALEIFFLTKGIFHDTDKIAIIGSLI
ncbi:hypothetical protein PCASD_10681 [Puccinia coronata f. sp. avenae]|uniref:Uncharacterized protein n=1 Tax=Puccinia coronata f. sp. avenae TaxID=200324 RepID=A0A2N5UI90_9BASI|nr:hypothetical protein PCASD_10681 [Puccinia coronata f. sp. avenae]